MNHRISGEMQVQILGSQVTSYVPSWLLVETHIGNRECRCTKRDVFVLIVGKAL